MPDEVSQSSLSTRGSDELSRPVPVRTWLTEDTIDQREHAIHTDRWLKASYCQLNMRGYETFCYGEYDETWSEDLSSWHRSAPRQLALLTTQQRQAFCLDNETWSESEDLSSWNRSAPKLSYNTAERQSPSSPLHHASVDEQLHDWRAFWSSYPSADPFRCDWTPQPFEYHA
jgi:hypothetical protein